MFSSLTNTGIGHSGMDFSVVRLEVTSIAATLLQFLFIAMNFRKSDFSFDLSKYRTISPRNFVLGTKFCL